MSEKEQLKKKLEELCKQIGALNQKEVEATSAPKVETKVVETKTVATPKVVEAVSNTKAEELVEKEVSKDIKAILINGFNYIIKLLEE